MDWMEERFLDGVIIFLNMVLTILILKVCLNLDSMGYIFITVLFIVGLIITWIYDEKIKSLEQKLILTMFILCAVLLIVIVFKSYAVSFVIDGIRNNMDMINSNMRAGRSSSFKLIENLLILTIPTLTPVGMWLKKRGFGDVIIFINMFLMMLYWYLGYYEELNKVIYIFVFISILTYSANNLGIYLKKLKRKEIRNNVVTSKIIWSALIVSVVSSMLITVLPKSASGKFAKIITDKVVENIADDGGEGFNGEKYGYTLARSGYSDSSKILGGPVNIDDREAFKLEYSGDIKDDIYLKGTVKDKYTGVSWQSEYKIIEKSNMMDSGYYTNFNGAKEETMTIHPDYITTTTLFNPYYSKVVNIKYNNDNKAYVDKVNGAFYSQKPIKTEYTINFYSDSIYDKKFDAPPVKNTGAEINELLNNGDMAYFLQLPNTITQRTVDLVYDIVKGTSSNEEKVYRLKTYLMKNYQYNLDVPAVPAGKDFVDYFLFEEKKGYCVYFATAMTVMCRIAGIPARYVEGFKVSNDKKNNTMYKVTNEDAHAWSEVYLTQNVGEQNLFSNSANSSSVVRLLPFIKIDTVPSTYEYRHNKEIQNNNQGGSGGADGAKSTSSNANQNNTKKVNLDKDLNGSNSKNYYLYLRIVIPVAIIFLYIAIRIVIEAANRRKVLKGDSLIPLYNYCKSRLKKVNIIKADSETDLEYAKNIPNYDMSKKMELLVELIYREFYANEGNLNYNRTELVDFVEDTVRAYQGNIKYILKKYILF